MLASLVSSRVCEHSSPRGAEDTLASYLGARDQVEQRTKIILNRQTHVDFRSEVICSLTTMAQYITLD